MTDNARITQESLNIILTALEANENTVISSVRWYNDLKEVKLHVRLPFYDHEELKPLLLKAGWSYYEGNGGVLVCRQTKEWLDRILKLAAETIIKAMDTSWSGWGIYTKVKIGVYHGSLTEEVMSELLSKFDAIAITFRLLGIGSYLEANKAYDGSIIGVNLIVEKIPQN